MPSAPPSLAFLLRGRDTSKDEAGEHTIRKERAPFEREGCSHFQVGPLTLKKVMVIVSVVVD